jgi:predicted outer membrane repeat protein
VGGAIYNGGEGSAITITVSEFKGNTADKLGGAIYNGGEGSLATITGSEFEGNTADKAGNNIHNDDGGITCNDGNTFNNPDDNFPASLCWLLQFNPDNSQFSPLSTDENTEVETITLFDVEDAIDDIGFVYNWFGEDLTQVMISREEGVLFIGEDFDTAILFAGREINPSAGGAIKVGRNKSGADESFKVSFEDIYWRNDDEEYNGDGEVNVQVELFPNGDIIFCYGRSATGNDATGTSRKMYVGVEVKVDLYDEFVSIPYDPFNSDGWTTEWPTNSCWKFQMP